MTAYLWLKALHLIFMVAWFAGLFYIFRLYVYHVKFKEHAGMPEAYQMMEKRLLYIIMYPAMSLTLLFGFLMIAQAPTTLAQPWFQWKFIGVLLLMVYQFFATQVHHRMARGEYLLSEKACRILNEVPTLLLIFIILMAVLKP